MPATETLLPTPNDMKSWLEQMTTPVAAIGPALHPEIAIMQRRLLALFYEHRKYLSNKPTAFLVELKHRSEERANDSEFSVRTAAELTRTACLLILEDRSEAKGGAR